MLTAKAAQVLMLCIGISLGIAARADYSAPATPDNASAKAAITPAEVASNKPDSTQIPSTTPVNGAPADLNKAFGLSIAFGIDFYTSLYITSASTNGPNNIVSIDDSYRVLPSVWAAGTYTWPNVCKICGKNMRPGLFFATKLLDQTGTSISGAALGVQLSLVDQTVDSKVNRQNDPQKPIVVEPTWNIGVGWSIHRTQRLARGILEQEPLPAEYSSIKYKTSYSQGVVIMISRSVF